MPKPNPLETWENLLRDAVTSDEDERENALFMIGLILERHNKPNPDAPDLYETHLSRELLRLMLPDVRLKAAAVYLAKLAETQPDNDASALYALHRAKPVFYIEPLLTLLAEHGKKLSAEAAFEAAQALITAAKQPPTNLRELLAAQNPSDLLDYWAENGDIELADKCDRALEKLVPYLPADDADKAQ